MRTRRLLTILALLPVLAWTLFPLYWILTASFKTELGLYAKPPQWIFSPILENYKRVLFNIPFFEYLWNSTLIAVGTTVGSLVLGTLAGYGFSRVKFRGSEALRFLVLLTRMVPRMTLVVPYYLMMLKIGPRPNLKMGPSFSIASTFVAVYWTSSLKRSQAVTQAKADLEKLERKLGNEGFLAKAAPEIVEKDRARAAELADAVAKLTAQLAELAD